ncbi:MAG: amidohydrolase family protein [Bdellovibrionota bacterium]
MLVDVFQNMNGQFCFKNVDVIVGDGQVFKKCYLAIDEKKISYIDDKPPLWLQNNPQNIVDGNGYLVIPGLINAHTHAAMGFFRDLGHQRQSMIESFLFPAEKSLYPELIEPLTWSFIYGSLLSGVTCIVDHYYFSKGVGTALEKIGMRGVLGETVADIGGAFPGEDSLNRALEDLESWNFSERIKPAIAPHAADTVSDKLLKKLSK